MCKLVYTHAGIFSLKQSDWLTIFGSTGVKLLFHLRASEWMVDA